MELETTMETNEAVTVRINHLLELNFKVPEDERKVVFEPLKRKLLQHFKDGKASLLSICSCRYVEIDDKTGLYKDFSYWSFGVHSKPWPETLLFGRLYIEKLEGRLMFADNFHKMPLAITDSPANHLSMFYNAYVLLKDYKIITEIFKDPKVRNWEYLIVNFEDIILVHTLEECSLLGTIPPSKEFRFKEEIIIIRKSQVSLREMTVMTVETYLEIIFVKTGKRVYLTLPGLYTRIHLFLREGFKYNLYINDPFTSRDNFKLSLIEKLECLVFSSREPVYFEEVGMTDNFTKKETTDLISIERAVWNRDFVENFHVNHLNLTGLPNGFKNLDNKTNTVNFSESKQDGLRLYLSNNELKVRPMGIIPEMILRVKNVRKKPKYLQPTVFTTIEIVRYQPKVPFCTVNLSITMNRDWGPKYFLSKGNEIPKGVVIWSEIYEINIYELKINRILCETCKNIEGLSDKGPTACKEDKMEFWMVIYATDMFGRSRVFTDEANFVKKLLNFNDVNFERLLEMCRLVNGSYSFSDNSDQDDSEENQIYMNQMGDNYLYEFLLTKFIRYLNQRSLPRFLLNIKCQKVSDTRPTFKPRPTWKLLGIRTAN